ncbi:hypothetical protein B9N43_04325 [Denitratisoma sp. DHT3]|uniref:energy transducer TonB n=1 Tax=Denitratisoma sp. DHT3 TaxID=1981880 RepID=UPI001198C8AC|nr:energy transducer TonB [Denitratisoma sp. DHT3]QDX80545.1 hypothetical protein B9N43_04325 [Denitratisoma sp. DHT3]
MTRHRRQAALRLIGVGLAHAAILGAMLNMAPPVRNAPAEVMQVGIVAPPAPESSNKPAQARPPSRLAVAPATIQKTETAPAIAFIEETPAVPVAEAPAAAALPRATAPALVPPLFSADYLENPPPRYPPMSRRRREQGNVTLRVFVSAEGSAERIEIQASSGFERLDQAAREAVESWRFVPARRGQQRVAAWVLVPIQFAM